MNVLLDGFWMRNSDSNLNQMEFMQISGNRIVHYPIPEMGHKPIPMRVFFSRDSDNTYTMTYTPGGNTWTRELVLTGDTLTIQAEATSFIFRRASKEHVPDWFLTAVEQSHRKMNELQKK